MIDQNSFKNLSLEGKVAVITGATQGLGEATAHLFADRGIAESGTRQCSIGLVGVVGDELLDPIECARLDDRLLERRDLAGIELGIADELVEDATRRRSQGLARIGDEHRALAFAEVVAGWLAGDRFVAEYPQHVVAQLERHTERVPERRECSRLRGISPSEGRADRERLLHAVAR